MRSWYGVMIVLCSLFQLGAPDTLKGQVVISLAEAIQSGLSNNKNIQAGDINIDIGNLQTHSLNRKFWPIVSLDYSYHYNPILQTSIIPIGIFNPAFPIDATENIQFGTNWSQSAGLSLTQPIFDIGISKTIQQAKLRNAITDITQNMAIEELAYAIAKSYVTVYLDAGKVDNGIADTLRTFTSYTLLKNLYIEERLLVTDLNKAIINHNNSKQLLSDATAALQLDKLYLLFLMGKSEQLDFITDSTFLSDAADAGIFELNFVTPQTAVQQLLLSGQLSAMEANAVYSKLLPTLYFVGYLGANQYTDTFNPIAADSWFGISYVGVELKFSLLSGVLPENQQAQLLLKEQQYQLQSEAATLELNQKSVEAKLSYDNLTQRLLNQSENIGLYETIVQVMQFRVTEGQELASTLNSEEAELQFLIAEYDSNVRQQWFFMLDYLKSSGQLSRLWE
jgi:outer membrane protein